VIDDDLVDRSVFPVFPAHDVLLLLELSDDVR
jgi:hypothetical protein